MIFDSYHRKTWSLKLNTLFWAQFDSLDWPAIFNQTNFIRTSEFLLLSYVRQCEGLLLLVKFLALIVQSLFTSTEAWINCPVALHLDWRWAHQNSKKSCFWRRKWRANPRSWPSCDARAGHIVHRCLRLAPCMPVLCFDACFSFQSQLTSSCFLRMIIRSIVERPPAWASKP